MIDTNVKDLLERGSKHGLVGLKNLGNTCFMNSALQCLSHCEDLTKYFLLKKFIDELNRNNPHGSNGEVAKAYYELIKELWLGQSSYLCPSDFRQIFVRFVRQFAGFSQHDSHEMLTFMLDTLHEDLNRVKSKPYCEMTEKMDKETDHDASIRWWKIHTLRENSIIVDLFHGQYKSVITCPECNKISITFDPFMYLGLPIPSGQYRIKFKYFPYESSYTYNLYEIEIPINEHTSLKDLKLKIIEKKLLSINVNSNAINFNPCDLLDGICLNKDKSFKKIVYNDELIFNYFENGYEISLYEKYPRINNLNPDNYITVYLVPVEMGEENRFLFMKKSTHKTLSYPSVISLNKKNTIKDLHFYIFKLYRKVIQDDRNTSYSKFLENINNKEYTEREFELYFKNYEEAPFKLDFVNNIPETSSFFSSKPNCEFCNKNCEYCKLIKSCGFKDTLDSIVSRQKVFRPLVLYVELLKLSSRKLYDLLEFPIIPNSKHLITKQNGINVYDCLNLFRTEERLEKDNAWYCSQCKKHQEAFKKMDIYRAPNYLIIQFKRFKIRSNTAVVAMFANKKNDCLIDYPIEGLDLTQYITGEDNKNLMYDLVGISQHFGSMSSGHYTALCKNFGAWYEFDDDRVSKANSNEVVNGAAYMLFYKKRQINK